MTLTREERLELLKIKEDYLFIFIEKTYLREEEPEMWHFICDQYEAVRDRLEEDEHEKIMGTCTHRVEEDGTVVKIQKEDT